MIAQGKISTEKLRKFLIAEDVLPITNELPVVEAARLVQMIVGRLAEQCTRCASFQDEKPSPKR